jgi:hypothetical protein
MPLDLSWFEPLPKQLGFISSTEREVVYAGGFGSGKTLSGGFKVLRAALEHPGTVGLVARQTAGALADNTQKILLRGDDKPPIIPEELVASTSEKYGTTITLHNGSEILFRSFQDWNEKRLLGPNYGFVYIDEATECTERVWLAFLSRLRHPAGPEQAWATTNPNGHDWLWKRFHPDAGEPNGALFHAPTEENTHLSADYIKWLRSQPREWQKRFVDASFDTAAGQIWDEWDRKVHVIDPFEIPYNWPWFEAIDHGRRNPTAYLQAVEDSDRNMIVVNGYYEPGLVSQHAAAIHSLRRVRNKWGAVVAPPDCWAAGADGRAVVQIYEQHRLALARGNNNVEAGLLRVSEWLTRREGETFPDWHQWAGTLGPDGRGSPRLFVFDAPGTNPLRMEIPDYRWRDLSAASERDRDQPEEPRKKDDHACDALRYLVMSRARPVTPLDPDKVGEREELKQITAGLRDRVF